MAKLTSTICSDSCFTRIALCARGTCTVSCLTRTTGIAFCGICVLTFGIFRARFTRCLPRFTLKRTWQTGKTVRFPGFGLVKTWVALFATWTLASTKCYRNTIDAFRIHNLCSRRTRITTAFSGLSKFSFFALFTISNFFVRAGFFSVISNECICWTRCTVDVLNIGSILIRTEFTNLTLCCVLDFVTFGASLARNMFGVIGAIVFIVQTDVARCTFRLSQVRRRLVLAFGTDVANKWIHCYQTTTGRTNLAICVPSTNV